MLLKSKASVYGRTSSSVKDRIRASLRRKTLAKKINSVPEGGGTAWWQQTSIDMGDSDSEANQK